MKGKWSYLLIAVSVVAVLGSIQTFGKVTNKNASLMNKIEEGLSEKEVVSGDLSKLAAQPLVQTASKELKKAAVPGKETQETSKERVTYQEGFYYEPISEEIKQRIYGKSYKENCTVPYEDLRYVSVLYTDFENNSQVGEIICNKSIAQDLVEIFYELHQAAYPIEKIRLIDEYEADDDLSMEDNNTSSFNFRVVQGSKNLSKHAYGRAIDINPFYNPYVEVKKGVMRVSPEASACYADRSIDFPYKIDEQDLCYQLFTEHGFTWGGSWKTMKDYQHFQK